MAKEVKIALLGTMGPWREPFKRNILKQNPKVAPTFLDPTNTEANPYQRTQEEANILHDANSIVVVLGDGKGSGTLIEAKLSLIDAIKNPETQVTYLIQNPRNKDRNVSRNRSMLAAEIKFWQKKGLIGQDQVKIVSSEKELAKQVIKGINNPSSRRGTQKTEITSKIQKSPLVVITGSSLKKDPSAHAAIVGALEGKISHKETTYVSRRLPLGLQRLWWKHLRTEELKMMSQATDNLVVLREESLSPLSQEFTAIAMGMVYGSRTIAYMLRNPQDKSLADKEKAHVEALQSLYPDDMKRVSHVYDGPDLVQALALEKHE